MTAGEFSWEGSTRVQLADGIEWMISKHLKHMECYFDNQVASEARVGRVAINEQTWETLKFENAQAEVEAMAKNGVTGMTFLVTDSGPFARAVAAEAASKGLDKPIAKDPLTQLEEQAQGLIAQAAGINGATEVQMEIFTVRYAAMNADFAALAERMAKIKSLIDLAGLAVAEAV